MNKFSWQEFFIGMAATASLVFLIGGWAVPLAVVSGALWMLGGTFKKGIRRYGVPFTISFFMAVSGVPYWTNVGASVLGLTVLHIGDGFPDRRPTTADEGSWLGRQVERIFPDDRIGGPVTKWLIPIIFQVSLVPYWTGR